MSVRLDFLLTAGTFDSHFLVWLSFKILLMDKKNLLAFELIEGRRLVNIALVWCGYRYIRSSSQN